MYLPTEFSIDNSTINSNFLKYKHLFLSIAILNADFD